MLNSNRGRSYVRRNPPFQGYINSAFHSFTSTSLEKGGAVGPVLVTCLGAWAKKKNKREERGDIFGSFELLLEGNLLIKGKKDLREDGFHSYCTFSAMQIQRFSFE